jgi:hypothetical protein
MKVLLDECVPRRLKKNLSDHECHTVAEQGLAGKKNGELLSLAEKAGFDAFLTLDRGIEFQQNLQSRRIAILVVSTPSSRFVDLLPLVPDILTKLHWLGPGQVVKVK